MERKDLAPLKPISQLLAENEVEDWDPRVVYQLLEFQYRTTKELLNQSYAYSKHRGGQQGVVEKDVKLALELQEENQSFRRPTKLFAKTVNANPIPSISESSLRLPKNSFLNDACISELIIEEVVEDSIGNGAQNGVEDNSEKRSNRSVGKFNIKRKRSNVQINTQGTTKNTAPGSESENKQMSVQAQEPAPPQNDPQAPESMDLS